MAGVGPRIKGVSSAVAPALMVLLATVSCAPDEPTFDRDRIEAAEDLAESLANDLLALSVAVRDGAPLDAWLSDRVEIDRFPVSPGAELPLVRGVVRREWDTAEPGLREVDRVEALGRFAELLGHFSEIDDARFKVKASEIDPLRPGTGTARLKMFIIGRDEKGRRDWLRGYLNATVERPEGGIWRFRKIEFEPFESRVSEVDLFSEVSLNAGVSEVFPPFGTGANASFVSHGAAVADVNLDGLLDIVATGVQQNYLYLNRGDGGFDDVSADSFVEYAPPGSGPLFVDYDNDGDPDLFFATVGVQTLLENRWVPDGKLEFWDVSDAASVALPGVGFSATAADIDGDGDTDIHVASYNRFGTVMPNAWDGATNGTPNLLFVNRGDGTFLESARDRGLADSRWSYAAAFADMDDDGDLDLYVANDFGTNALYRNDGGSFTDVAREMGLQDTGFGMGVSFGDYDNDGDLDLHVTNMSSTAGKRILGRLQPEDRAGADVDTLGKLAAGNSLYQNQGGGVWRDVTADAGGFSAGWAFGGGFFDLDNDGYEDLYTPNGFISGKSMKDT